MADWKRTVHIESEWSKTREGEMTVQQLSAALVTKLKQLEPFTDPHSYINEELESLIYEFESLSEDEDADSDDFDLVMEQLFDWGDIKLDNRFNGAKVCFIHTF
jgi:hypothetical protein